jgi:hypothetical protein
MISIVEEFMDRTDFGRSGLKTPRTKLLAREPGVTKILAYLLGGVPRPDDGLRGTRRRVVAI